MNNWQVYNFTPSSSNHGYANYDGSNYEYDNYDGSNYGNFNYGFANYDGIDHGNANHETFNLPNCVNAQEFEQMVAIFLPPNYQTDQDCYINNVSQRIGWTKLDEPLRNANQQIRSEPYNPQIVLSIWNQSTINPDIRRCKFEIAPNNCNF